ncbi:uncharacterized protein PV09_09744 [Verruconis gallopava]|uniref:Zn(2)-C6 fungal-type domain-containing protein n=1 Tax=Verruconis gallopava TaxID=253628 RepID=A0A0D1YCP5_9PEZI|nr:uncharacterized protein PV09_09744 [Verruconis gallopava]KIV98446.1 hypothetical protein PV09_09744 [Verruconis gallopava]
MPQSAEHQSFTHSRDVPGRGAQTHRSSKYDVPKAPELDLHRRLAVLGIRFVAAEQLSLQSRSVSKSAACTMCWVRKVACRKEGKSICRPCIKLEIPNYICNQERMTAHKPFEKWKDKIYELLSTTVKSFESQDAVQAELQHYSGGPYLNVACQEFVPADDDQVYVLEKSSDGWQLQRTHAFCLSNPAVDISAYVKNCIPYAVAEAIQRQDDASELFRLSCENYAYNPLIYDCMELYTTLRLLQRGWRFKGQNPLGMAMPVITDRNSAWYGAVPPPERVQKQLDHRLELHMIQVDERVLKNLQKLFLIKDNRVWAPATLATFHVLHVRELDGGRILHWNRYHDTARFWNHPSKPATLIGETVLSCNSILWHYHCAIGQIPLELDWDDPVRMAMVGNDELFLSTMKSIQLYVQMMRTGGKIGRKASVLYTDGNPNSVTFTISSLLFTTMKSCVVSDFY